jgi:hypothetical protein
MTRISIHSIELTPLEAEVLSEILAAKLDQHIADRARYIRKDSQPTEEHHAPEVRLVAETGVSSGGWRPLSVDDSDSASADQASAHIQDAGNPGAAKPALFTIRCPECGGPLIEDQPDHGVHCPDCWAWECRQEES